MTDTRVILDTLIEFRARYPTSQVLEYICPAAQAAFQRAFPNGAPDWRAVAAYPDCRPEWRDWIAICAPDLTLDERKALAVQSDNSDFWRDWIMDRYAERPKP